MLYVYSQISPKISILGILIKKWAKFNKVQSKDCLTSYSLIILMLNYLIQLNYIPILQQLNPQVHKIQIKRHIKSDLQIFTTNAYFEDDLNKIHQYMKASNMTQLNHTSVFNLLLGFWDYYIKYLEDFREYVASLEPQAEHSSSDQHSSHTNTLKFIDMIDISSDKKTPITDSQQSTRIKIFSMIDPFDK